MEKSTLFLFNIVSFKEKAQRNFERCANKKIYLGLKLELIDDDLLF
ncbi:hypothetical protein D931_01622 [Enterococcus faecium 13.SD.W.09]|nr:hypothetical protein D931_01622 [Enterococcus faecium 13.SD.W.09]